MSAQRRANTLPTCTKETLIGMHTLRSIKEADTNLDKMYTMDSEAPEPKATPSEKSIKDELNSL